MNKLLTSLFVVILVVTFAVADVVAQGGRQGNQHRNGVQSGSREGNQRGQQGKQHHFARGRTGQAGQGNTGNRISQRNLGNTLKPNERQGLILLREEEKLARDVYTALHAKWGDTVFANISRVESKHMNAVGSLLARYGIPDPIKNNAAGIFTSPQFQQLYNTVVNKGSNSLADALRVGLKIEEMDIADLRAAIQDTNNQDIQRVLENLLRGSRNHLRAFASRLKAVGGTYVATNLNQADFNQIARSSQESGGGRDNRKTGGRNGQVDNGTGNGDGKKQSQVKG